MEKKHINELINGLKISDSMKREFINLNFMYYSNYFNGNLTQPYTWKFSPDYLALDIKDRKQIAIGGSVLAFFISFFAYFFRGLFLKGFIFAAGFFVILLLSLLAGDGAIGDIITRALGLGYAMFLAFNLRKDYFYEKCLNNKEIHALIKRGLVDFKPNSTYRPIPKKK
jgi:hypothetical protein